MRWNSSFTTSPARSPRISRPSGGSAGQAALKSEDKKTDGGGDYFAISPKATCRPCGDDGVVLNEGPSVLQYLADRKPEGGAGAGLGRIEAISSSTY